MPREKLTAKQNRFVKEYLKDLNATQAAIRAGYAKKTAKVIGNENLSKPYLKEIIVKAINKRNEKLDIDAAYVLKRHHEIDQMDLLDILEDDLSFKSLKDWPKVWRTYISGFDLAEVFEAKGDEREIVGILKKIKWPDKLKNLEMLGKHVSVNAYKESHDHTSSDGSLNQIKVSLVDKTGNTKERV